MTNQELYKQALLDAKAVRETALAHAKASLSEAFEPRIKEMMRLKLAEELEDETKMEESMEDESKMEESMKDESKVEESMEDESAGMKDEGMKDEGTDHMMDEATLDEILAELEALSEEMETEADTMEEGHIKSDGHTGGKKSAGKDAGYTKATTTTSDKKLHEADSEEEGEEEEEESGKDAETSAAPAADSTDEAGDDETVVDITVGELKDIIRDVFMQLQGGGMGAEMEPASDEENAMMAPMGGKEEEGEMEEISLDEILAELEAESKSDMEEGMEKGLGDTPAMKADNVRSSVEETKKKEDDKMKKDLEEANKAVEAMRSELNEINLLNAKLLYFNKILKAKNLNESQKVKVMNAFDRAVSVKEVENTYKTLSESLDASKKTNLKESIGFASKPIGNAPAKPIVDADPFVNRWQVLAGIKH